MSALKPSEPSEPVLSISRLSVSSLSAPSSESSEAHKSLEASLLYRDVNLTAQRGDIILLLGASGSGKSLLMNLLIGKVSPTADSLMIEPEGSVALLGHELLSERYPTALEGELGVLFQGLGLLEDLTARQNLTFAHDYARHTTPTHEWSARLEELAEQLHISEHLDRPVSALSGGQRQRVALGRLLAYRARVMLFDEPTSALDPLSSDRVVNLIKEAHERAHSELTIIITHDYQSFLPIADQVWSIQSNLTIRADSPPRTPTEYHEGLKSPREPQSVALTQGAWLEHVAQQRDRKLRGSLRALPHELMRITRPLVQPQQAKWVARYGSHLFKEVVFEGLAFHLVAGLIVGMIATYFTFNSHMGTVAIERLIELQGEGGETREVIEVSRFILPTFFKEMLAGFSAVMYRALIPVFTCIFVAARGGTAATAYLSGMRDPSRHEWDALTSFGVNPRAFFGLQLTLTFALGCVLLSGVAFLAASVGSLFTSLWTNPLCDLPLWWGAFTEGLKLNSYGVPNGTGGVLLKATLSGVCIALVSLSYGSRPRERSREVMTNLGASNVWSVLLTLIVFFVILVLETR